jgi:hypothetical protein
MIANIIAEITLIFIRHSKFAQNYLSPISFYTGASTVGALMGCACSMMSASEMREMKPILVGAMVYTATIFGTMTLFSFLTLNRTKILLGSLITSLVLSIFSLFLYRDSGLSIAIGILVGSLYIICDTQIMIYKAENGTFEPYHDARQIFYDCVKIFIEITKLLSKDNKKKDK